MREEYNLPLTKESYEHLLEKADGTVITKTRYRIPEKNGLTIELDVFHGRYGGLLLAEVEFATEEEANSYCPPEWFGEDVTMFPQNVNDIKYAYAFCINGCVGMIKCWLTGDSDDTPEHMAYLTHNIVSEAPRNFAAKVLNSAQERTTV